MKAVVAAFNQEKALVGAFSVTTNLRMELFEALVNRTQHQELCWLLVADPPNVEFIKDSENVERTVQSAEVARKSVLCRHLQLTKTISSGEVLFSIFIFVDT